MEAKRLGTLPEAIQLVKRQSPSGLVSRMWLLTCPPSPGPHLLCRACWSPASTPPTPPLQPGELGHLTCKLALLQEALQEGRI